MPDESHSDSNPARIVALCEQARAGDVTALEALLALHQGRLLGFAARKIGPDWQGKIEPEDVVQEAYVAAFKHIATFTAVDAEAFYRWVTQIIENCFLDHVRHWRRQKRDVARLTGRGDAQTSKYDSLLQQCSQPGPNPSHFARHEEAVGALMGCLARLSDEYRTVVTRVHLNNESYQAVADDLGNTSEGIRRMTGRALDKLRECLGRASLYLSRLG